MKLLNMSWVSTSLPGHLRSASPLPLKLLGLSLYPHPLCCEACSTSPYEMAGPAPQSTPSVLSHAIR